MGIHQLNRFIKDKCKGAISPVYLKDIRNKAIVIDTSIYIYKYANDGSVVEGMFKMISTLLFYNIRPIFIFDGKTPAEKKQVVISRRERKEYAEKKHNELKTSLIKMGKTKNFIDNNKQLQSYKKDFVKIKWYEIADTKEMMDLYGIEYFEAEFEADKMCAEFVLDGKAWACLSEDTDMFAYGCPRILRYISFLTNKAILYDMSSILNTLTLSQHEFTQLCVFTGTDYNTGIGNIYCIYKKILLYKTFDTKLNLDTWMKNKYNIILTHPLDDTCAIFEKKHKLSYMSSKKRTPNMAKLLEFLKQFNFIFLNENTIC